MVDEILTKLRSPINLELWLTDRFSTSVNHPSFLTLLIVKVPENVKPGASVMFYSPDGVRLHGVVPRGKEAGEDFEVIPPAVMVQVPAGAKPGDTLVLHPRPTQLIRRLVNIPPVKPLNRRDIY